MRNFQSLSKSVDVYIVLGDALWSSVFTVYCGYHRIYVNGRERKINQNSFNETQAFLVPGQTEKGTSVYLGNFSVSVYKKEELLGTSTY